MADQIIVPILLVLVTVSVCVFADTSAVHTANGIIEGRVENVSGKNVNVFWGIPYAEPPLGELRFKKPVPAKPWKEPLKAVNQPNACYQATIGVYTDAFEGIRMWYPQTNLSEDCLYLNVWSPEGANNFPVVVWIHGGSFAAGSSATDLYNGKYLSTRNDIIVVSINYRLGALGFLFLGIEETPGNMGLYDQQLALKWVQDNIGQFGGDKTRVTIFGSSAGGASITYHLMMPSSWPLFNNGMMQGGSALAHWASKSARSAVIQSTKIAKYSGCEISEGIEQIYKCLMDVDPQDLSNYQWEAVEYYNAVPIGPIVDGILLEDTPLNLARSGRVKNTSLIAGFNRDEGMMLLQIEEIGHRADLNAEEFLRIAGEIVMPMQGEVINTTVNEYSSFFSNHNDSYVDILDNMLGDLVIKCPVIDFATYYSNIGNDVYIYMYDHMSSGNPWPKWMGVLHGYEIDHFFGRPYNGSRVYTDLERQLSTKMMRAFSNLAKTGDPNSRESGKHEDFKWPKFTSLGKHHVFKTSVDEQESPELPYHKCAYWRGVLTQINEAEYATCGVAEKTFTLITVAIFVSLYCLLT